MSSERLPQSLSRSRRVVSRSQRLAAAAPTPAPSLEVSPGDSPDAASDKLEGQIVETISQTAEVAIEVQSKTAPLDPSLASRWLLVEAWGDSLTAGSGSTSASTTYPAVLSSLTSYSVANNGVGGETSIQIRTRLVAATTKHLNPTVIWVGRNNYTTPDQVVADVATMVETLRAAGNEDRYLVLGVLNGSYGGYEAPGGAGYEFITGINQRLSDTYGDRYVPIREHLVSLYNPGSPTDVADHTADRPPSSLRSDAIHLNDAGYAAVAAFVETYIDRLRGTWPDFLSAKNLASPPAIGTSTACPEMVSTIFRVGTPATHKFFSLSGDGSSIQSNGHVIPLAHDSVDLGYSGALAWRDAFLSRNLYAPFVRVGTPTTHKFLSLSGDGNSIQTNGNLIPLAHATNNVGFSEGLAFADGFFSGSLFANRAVVSNAYKLSRYSDNAGAGYASGATVDLFTVGAYAKVASGVLTVKAYSASSRWAATYTLAIIGGGDTVAVTPSASQAYGATSLEGTLSVVKDSPAGGTDVVRFTVGANAITALEFFWSPLVTESGTVVALA